MNAALNIYKRPDAVRVFLDPGRRPYFPLVEIPDTLNLSAGDRARERGRGRAHAGHAHRELVTTGRPCYSISTYPFSNSIQNLRVDIKDSTCLCDRILFPER